MTLGQSALCILTCYSTTSTVRVGRIWKKRWCRQESLLSVGLPVPWAMAWEGEWLGTLIRSSPKPRQPRAPICLTEVPRIPRLGPGLRHLEVKGSGADGGRGKGCVVPALSQWGRPRA